MDGMGTADVSAAGLRKTEKSYLPQVDQITDRVGHLLDRHVGIDAVLIRQVDIVGAKPAQGALHRLTNLLRPSITIGADPACCARNGNRFGEYIISSLQDRI
jgi:hypothetical protein